MKAIERFYQYIEYKGIKPTRFEKDFGLSNGYLGTQLKRKGNLGEDILNSIVDNCLDISPEWLLTGQGSMLKANEKENKIIAERIDTFSLKLTNENLIPIMDIETIGGFGSANFSISQNNISDYCQIPAFKGKKVDFMIPVRGFSMYPRYKTGDLVACTIISENTFIQWNEVHVIATREQGILLKRLNKSEKAGYLKAISDNKDFPPIDIPESEITGIALVVGGVCVE